MARTWIGKRGWAAPAGGVLVVLALALVVTSPAEARNRFTDALIAEIVRSSGMREADVRHQIAYATTPDTDIAPGISHSSGGIAYPGSPSHMGVMLSNENNFPICVRAKAAFFPGTMTNSSQTDNLGGNLRVEARSSVMIIQNRVAHFLDNIAVAGQYGVGYVFWLPSPTATERTCSASEPEGVAELLGNYQPRPGDKVWVFTTELAQRLGI